MYLLFMIHKQKSNKLGFIKIKTFATLRGWNEKFHIDREYLQTIYLIRDSYVEYVKNLHNSIATKNTVQLENKQETFY